MNDTVRLALERMLAEIPARTPSTDPAAELGFGRDLSCVTDCTDDFATIGPNDPRIILQKLARRFQTPRGTLLSDPDFGLDLRGRLHKASTAREIRMLQSQAVGEALKDERVERASIVFSFAYVTGVLDAAIHITPRDPRVAPFAGVLRITSQAIEVVT